MNGYPPVISHCNGPCRLLWDFDTCSNLMGNSPANPVNTLFKLMRISPGRFSQMGQSHHSDLKADLIGGFNMPQLYSLIPILFKLYKIMISVDSNLSTGRSDRNRKNQRFAIREAIVGRTITLDFTGERMRSEEPAHAQGPASSHSPNLWEI